MIRRDNDMTKAPDKLHTPDTPAWMFIAILAVTVVVYFPGLTGDYVFDDLPNLVNNAQLDLESLSLESLQGAAYSSNSGMLRRPVSMASFAINRHLFGIDPYSHKVVNLIIHLLTGIGLFILSRQLVQSYRRFRNPALTEATIRWLPVIVSGLWLVHPINLTSVLYIVQRMTSLSTLFMVGALCLYLACRYRMLTGGRGVPFTLAGVAAFTVLAVFSKESGALLPLYMLVLEIALFRFRNTAGILDKRVAAFFIFTVLLPAALVLFHIATSSGGLLGAYAIRDFNLTERVLTEARVLVFYLKMIIMPSTSELGLYHDDITLSHHLLDPPSTLVSIVLLCGLLFSAFLLLGKHSLIGLGILWFFAGHALESTIFPLEIAHEHRNYLAGYGILLAVTGALLEGPWQRVTPLMRSAVPVVLLLLFSHTTWLRAGQWSDVATQAAFEASHHPDSYRSVYGLARIYTRLTLNGEPGYEEKAFANLLRAAEIKQAEIMPHSTMIQLAYLTNKPVDPGWFDEISQRLSRYPVTPSTIHSLLSLARCAERKCGVPEDRMEELLGLLLVQESLQSTPSRLAEAHTIYGYFTINTRGDFHKGLELFKLAVNLTPREHQRWINLIELLIVMQKFEEAEENIDMFRKGNTYGGNEAIYSRLQQSLDKMRSKQASPPTNDNPSSA